MKVHIKGLNRKNFKVKTKEWQILVTEHGGGVTEGGSELSDWMTECGVVWKDDGGDGCIFRVWAGRVSRDRIAGFGVGVGNFRVRVYGVIVFWFRVGISGVGVVRWHGGGIKRKMETDGRKQKWEWWRVGRREWRKRWKSEKRKYRGGVREVIY
jgi:hypothetical protein